MWVCSCDPVRSGRLGSGCVSRARADGFFFCSLVGANRSSTSAFRTRSSTLSRSNSRVSRLATAADAAGREGPIRAVVAGTGAAAGEDVEADAVGGAGGGHEACLGRGDGGERRWKCADRAPAQEGRRRKAPNWATAVGMDTVAAGKAAMLHSTFGASGTRGYGTGVHKRWLGALQITRWSRRCSL